MLRLIWPLRKAPGITKEAFEAHLRGRHAPLVACHARALKIHRYLQTYTLEDPLNEELKKVRGATEPYDGAMEFWWESKDALANALGTQEGKKALGDLKEDAKRFLTLSASSLWLALELPQINPTPENLVARPESPLIKLFYPLRRLSGLTMEEVQLTWRMQHGPVRQALRACCGDPEVPSGPQAARSARKGIKERAGSRGRALRRPC